MRDIGFLVLAGMMTFGIMTQAGVSAPAAACGIAAMCAAAFAMRKGGGPRRVAIAAALASVAGGAAFLAGGVRL